MRPSGTPSDRGSGEAEISVTGKDRITIVFPAVVSGMERLFDQVAMISAKSPKKGGRSAGTFLCVGL